jgi:hypothetical protein
VCGGVGWVWGAARRRRANKNQRGPLTPTLSPTLTRGGEGESKAVVNDLAVAASGARG